MSDEFAEENKYENTHCSAGCSDILISRCRSAASTGGDMADKILVEKKTRSLTLVSKGQVLRTYKVALGRSPEGPKEREGDNKTPEGKYRIDSRNSKSGFHRALHISYPGENDIVHAKQLGVSPGGNIMIHGIKNGLGWIGRLHSLLDWTQGCIAVTNEEIEEIWQLVLDGAVVEIRP